MATDPTIPGVDPAETESCQVTANSDPVTARETPTLAIVNASDDLKIDSLRRNTPYLLTLSETRGIPNNHETIEEPAPDYHVTPEPSTNSILKGIPDRNVIAAGQPETGYPTSGSREAGVRKDHAHDGRDARAFSEGRRPRGRGRRRRGRTTSGRHGADNPVFQPEVGATGRRHRTSEAEKANGFRKKVSWNETVVYNSDEKTDVIIAGLHEEESDTDDPEVGEYRYAAQSRSALAIIPEDQPIPRESDEWARRTRQGQTKDKASDYKCPLCSAVVLIALAVVGIVVLGTMYGVRYGNEKNTSEIIEDIKQAFSLLPSEANSLFLYTLYRPPSYQQQDGATYFLLGKDSIMPWQSPEGTATFTWLQGSPVKIQVIDRRGRVFLRMLSDPVAVQGAQYTVSMSSTDWYAAKLHDPNSYALIAVTQQGTSTNWASANISDLFTVVTSPRLRDKIAEYEAPKI